MTLTPMEDVDGYEAIFREGHYDGVNLARF